MTAHESLANAQTKRVASCQGCGATIHLVEYGVSRGGTKTFKWVTDPKKPKVSWKCGHDPDFPVKSHSPSMGD
jgi:hypothetical protein